MLKKSENAPLTPARLAHAVHEVGFPPGVTNSHMDIRMVDFTGSTFTGRKI